MSITPCDTDSDSAYSFSTLATVKQSNVLERMAEEQEILAAIGSLSSYTVRRIGKSVLRYENSLAIDNLLWKLSLHFSQAGQEEYKQNLATLPRNEIMRAFLRSVSSSKEQQSRPLVLQCCGRNTVIDKVEEKLQNLLHQEGEAVENNPGNVDPPAENNDVVITTVIEDQSSNISSITDPNAAGLLNGTEILLQQDESVSSTTNTTRESLAGSRILKEPVANSGDTRNTSTGQPLSSIYVADNQFLVNGKVIDLPSSGTVTRSVAEDVCKLVLHGARNGSGERQACKGMILIVGSKDQFEEFGYVQGENKFEGRDIRVNAWKEKEEFVLSCFLQDFGLFVDGSTGKILADHYKVDLSTRHADHGGGLKHVSASAAGMNGCLAIKCSEDCCMADGKGKGQLKIFSGVKTPVSVNVKPNDNYYDV